MFFISIALLFNFDITLLHSQSTMVLSWVHLYLLGFVMMSIFASMAQLLPVVLEVEHFSIEELQFHLLQFNDKLLLQKPSYQNKKVLFRKKETLLIYQNSFEIL